MDGMYPEWPEPTAPSLSHSDPSGRCTDRAPGEADTRKIRPFHRHRPRHSAAWTVCIRNGRRPTRLAAGGIPQDMNGKSGFDLQNQEIMRTFGGVFGEMQEWLNWPAWKASKHQKCFRGSNPLLSAERSTSTDTTKPRWRIHRGFVISVSHPPDSELGTDGYKKSLPRSGRGQANVKKTIL